MKILKLLCFIILFLTSLTNAQFPTFPPDSVTSTIDRDQMLWQLGISFPNLPPKLQDSNAPPSSFPSVSLNPEGNWRDSVGHFVSRSGFGLWNNYDDSSYGFNPGPEAWRLSYYPPIDLLKMKDGTTITTTEEWWNKRRPEILKDVQQEVWGVIPPDSILPEVKWVVTDSVFENDSLPFIQRKITGEIDISRYPEVRNVPVISAILRIPLNKKEPVPVMIVIGNSFWTRIENYWNHFSPYGWGACIFEAGMLQPDNGAGLTSYLISLCNKGNWRKPNDWGTLAAWSWGVSKLIDYFETDPDVDAAKIGVTGHSRFGKAALVTMAYEPRLVIAFPSCSGSLGAKMNRRHYGQDLENSGWDGEYHWVAGNFFKWMGPLNEASYLPRKIGLCPVDAHSLLSLCAPRPVFINGGTHDPWPDPYGMYLTCVNASPVYKLLGKQGLIMPDEKPKIDEGYISGDIAFRYHNGGHTDAPDWPVFFEFAKKYIKTNGF